MYASLIASAMQSDNDVHPSYIEIIHQLSSNDARTLQTFLRPLSIKQSNIRFLCYPIRLVELNMNVGFEFVTPDEISGISLFLSDNMHAFHINPATMHSFNSLKRLGLVNIRKEKISTFVLEQYGITVENNYDSQLSVYMVYLQLTSYGTKFANTCCDTEESSEFYQCSKFVSKVSMDQDGSGFSCT